MGGTEKSNGTPTLTTTTITASTTTTTTKSTTNSTAVLSSSSFSKPINTSTNTTATVSSLIRSGAASLMHNESVDLLLPKPIIVMDFPKSGTSSIFSFFQRQGLKAQHWYCCKAQPHPKTPGKYDNFFLMSECLRKNLQLNQSKNIFQGCGHSKLDVYSEINGPRQTKFHPKLNNAVGYVLDDGTVDYDGPPGERIFLPQHFRIQEIHESYPNATWILNWRDYDPWIESVIGWGKNEVSPDNLHYQFLNEYYTQGEIPYIPSEKNITDIKAVMKKIYYDHHNMVRNFVHRHPSHALVEVNITHVNASTVLAEAFGLSPNAWTNGNKNKKGSLSQHDKLKLSRQRHRLKKKKNSSNTNHNNNNVNNNVDDKRRKESMTSTN